MKNFKLAFPEIKQKLTFDGFSKFFLIYYVHWGSFVKFMFIESFYCHIWKSYLWWTLNHCVYFFLSPVFLSLWGQRWFWGTWDILTCPDICCLFQLLITYYWPTCLFIFYLFFKLCYNNMWTRLMYMFAFFRKKR